MKYTIKQLKHLRDIRAIGFDDYCDSGQVNEKIDFIYETKMFFDWIIKMEKNNKINELLKSLK